MNTAIKSTPTPRTSPRGRKRSGRSVEPSIIRSSFHLSLIRDTGRGSGRERVGSLGRIAPALLGELLLSLGTQRRPGADHLLGALLVIRETLEGVSLPQPVFFLVAGDGQVDPARVGGGHAARVVLT